MMPSTLQPVCRSERKDDLDPITVDAFQALLLSMPLESSKYAFISMFLARMLNVPNDKAIVDAATSPPSTTQSARGTPAEILPQVAVPLDLWLRPDVSILNLKLKVAILREVNSVLLGYAESLQTNELFLLDEIALMSLEKRISDCNLLDFNRLEPQRGFDGIREDDEYELDDAIGPMPPLKRSTVGTDTMLLPQSALTRPLSTASSINRISTLSRDLMGGKRKFSFLGQHHSPTLPAAEDQRRASYHPTTPNRTLPVLQPLPQFGNGNSNGFLSKSKLYNKIKKRRELYSLIGSTPTSVSSSASQPSFRRKSSAYDMHEAANGSAKPVDEASAFQLIENQRDKHEYYVQAQMLGEKSNFFIGYIGRSGSRANLLRIMEFIKNYVFKFITVDMAHMIIDYGHRRAGHEVPRH